MEKKENIRMMKSSDELNKKGKKSKQQKYDCQYEHA